MKVTPKQYAVLLYEMTRGVKGAELNKVIKQFVQLLERNRALGMFSRIERMYKDYYNVQEKVMDVEIVSVQDISKKVQHDLEEILGKKSKIELTERVDEGVLGGARIRVGDYMIDDTLKSRLAQLKNKLTT